MCSLASRRTWRRGPWREIPVSPRIWLRSTGWRPGPLRVGWLSGGTGDRSRTFGTGSVKTAATLTDKLSPPATGYHRLLALEEVGAHVEYLQSRRRIRHVGADRRKPI